MKKQDPVFFKPNWKAIYAAINEGGDVRKMLNEQLSTIQKKIRTKSDEVYLAKREQEKLDHVKALKALEKGARVSYTGVDKRIVLQTGWKVEDRRKYMVVTFDGNGKWTIPYSSLSVGELSQEQKSSIRVKANITELFTK